MSKYESAWAIAGRALWWSFCSLVFTALAVLVLVPRLLGGDSLTVLSGSMEPAFWAGDLIAVKGVQVAQVCEDIPVGSVITYFPQPNDPTLITHRVVGKTAGGYPDGTSCRLLTQGDANTMLDDPVSPAQVRGVLMYTVPKLGWVRAWTGSHPQALWYAGAGVLILAGVYSAVRKPRTRVLKLDDSQIKELERRVALLEGRE